MPIKKGDKIRINRQGSEVLTVLDVQGTTIWTYELLGTVHVTKVVKV